MKIYSDKHKLALALALSGKIPLPANHRVRLMRPATLYRLLSDHGWTWHGGDWYVSRAWEPVEPAKPEPVQEVDHQGQAGYTNVFMVRIMAHASRAETIVANMRELMEVFDWQILTISDPKANYGEEQWVRVYIRVRIPS